MAAENYAKQQAKIEKEIDRLKKKADALMARKRKPALQAILRDMREYGLTPDDIVAAFKKGASSSRKEKKPGVSNKSKRTVAPKYRHPETGETWTGRGKAPRWITEAELAGTDRNTFGVVSATDAIDA